MNDRAQYVVLCEDLQARVFIRRALIRGGANGRRIRPYPLPSDVDGGAGHDYVVKKYPEQVKAFRSQNASTKTGLVVHIDADPTHSVAERHAELAESLRTAGEAPRGTTEPLAELVPKRNIETWIYALDATLAARLKKPLDEVEAFPKLKENERDCSTAAEAFADHARQGSVPAAAAQVPSLRDGLAELRRLR